MNEPHPWLAWLLIILTACLMLVALVAFYWLMAAFTLPVPS